jgi:xanthine dehydrogenase large subunit
MLAISVREAIREAVAAFGSSGIVEMDAPSTPERIFFAIERARPQRLVSPRLKAEAVQR